MFFREELVGKTRRLEENPEGGYACVDITPPPGLDAADHRISNSREKLSKKDERGRCFPAGSAYTQTITQARRKIASYETERYQARH